MCYERGLAAIHLCPKDRIAQVEFLVHTKFVHKISGVDPLRQREEALRATYDTLDLDLVWATWDPIHPWDTVGKSGRIPSETSSKPLFGAPSISRDERHFAIRSDSWSRAFPTTWRKTFDINTIEDVLRFDPFEVWEVPTQQELTDFFRREHSKMQSFYKNQLVPGGKYQTCFMWLILTFGLEWTAKAAHRDPKRFEELLNRFGEISMLEFRAWSKTDIKAFISHDDICSTQGPFFSPKWLRRYIFPWYERLWSELNAQGIIVLFCTDGNITTIVDDIANLGAGGFIIEECSDLNYMAKKFGRRKVIIGGVDIGKLTYGSPQDVIGEVKRVVKTAGGCPGYFINVSGSIPDNVPMQNLETYFDACRTYGRRDQ